MENRALPKLHRDHPIAFDGHGTNPYCAGVLCDGKWPSYKTGPSSSSVYSLTRYMQALWEPFMKLLDVVTIHVD